MAFPSRVLLRVSVKIMRIACVSAAAATATGVAMDTTRCEIVPWNIIPLRKIVASRKLKSAENSLISIFRSSIDPFIKSFVRSLTRSLH